MGRLHSEVFLHPLLSVAPPFRPTGSLPRASPQVWFSGPWAIIALLWLPPPSEVGVPQARYTLTLGLQCVCGGRGVCVCTVYERERERAEGWGP